MLAFFTQKRDQMTCVTPALLRAPFAFLCGDGFECGLAPKIVRILRVEGRWTLGCDIFGIVLLALGHLFND